MVDFSNKIAIAEYRWKYAIYAILCWVIAAIGFFRITEDRLGVQYTIVLFVISALALYLTIALLHRRFIFIGRKGPIYNDFMNFKHSQLLKASGNLLFSKEGLKIASGNNEEFIAWEQIQNIQLTLEDTLSNDDDVVLTIHYGNKQVFRMDEETPGWLYFTETLPLYLTDIPANWLNDFIRSGNTRYQLWAA